MSQRDVVMVLYGIAGGLFAASFYLLVLEHNANASSS